MTGLKGSGKTTAANMLKTHTAYEIRSFAQPLKDLCVETFSFLEKEHVINPELKDKEFEDGCEIEILQDEAEILLSELEKLDIKVDNEDRELIIEKMTEKMIGTPRELLQFIGTDICRNLISDKIWLNLAVKGIKSTDKVIFDDVRFLNEATALRDLGGVIVELQRKEAEENIDSHETEQNIASLRCDALIPNLGSLEALQSRMLYVYNHFAPKEGLA